MSMFLSWVQSVFCCKTNKSRSGEWLQLSNKASGGSDGIGPLGQIRLYWKGWVSWRGFLGEREKEISETRGVNSAPAVWPVSNHFPKSVMGTSPLFSFHYSPNPSPILPNNSGITAYLLCVASAEAGGIAVLHSAPLVRSGVPLQRPSLMFKTIFLLNVNLIRRESGNHYILPFFPRQ